jgi:hypothetical protein
MDRIADIRDGAMRSPISNILPVLAIASAFGGVVLFATGEFFKSETMSQIGLVCFALLLLGAMIATIRVLFVAVIRVFFAGGWFSRPSATVVAEAGIYYVPALRYLPPAHRDDSPIPLSDPPAIPVPIRIEDRQRGQLWRHWLTYLDSMATYEGFRYEKLGERGFLMTLPRTRGDWQNNTYWLPTFCIDLVEDRELHLVVLDLSSLDETAINAVVSLLLQLDTQTLPTANVQGKLRIANASRAVTETLSRYNLLFRYLEKGEFTGN